ncbi:hypothetical protein [Streptomyces sp. NBC_01197]|uniref:hypothetical protein n=1 Tax=Streptomyces sp. NBC_01197 TaxID=2903768 RepID=UPI002E140EB8|nr:hypothetical protein OG452_35095 [Streptomyces sp. NBC_01197]
MSDLLIALGDAATHSTHLLAVPDPSKGGGNPPGMDKLLVILHWVFVIVTIACVAGILTVAGKMAIAHNNGEGREHMGGLGKVLFACVLAASASGIVTALT